MASAKSAIRHSGHHFSVKLRDQTKNLAEQKEKKPGTCPGLRSLVMVGVFKKAKTLPL
jgi:hypothetical protein